MPTTLVHDWLNQNGGAERVLEVLHGLYPDAPVYTSLYAPDRLPQAYRAWDIRTSFMQRLPLAKQRHRPFLPLYPFAFRRVDLSSYDLVISNSSGFCHCVPVPPGAVHVNYCLTPPRFLWSTDQYLSRERLPSPARAVLPPIVRRLRDWDARTAAESVTHFVAISRAVQQRIRTVYGRDSAVIYPPVDTAAFAPTPLDRPAAQVGNYYLVASRLIPYKRVDLAVRAFTQLGLPLVVAGSGRDEAALRALAGPNVRFEGFVSSARLKELYAGCRGFVFPGEEDFGIAPVEAQASGRPVIAYGAGGALDTVTEGATGCFFYDPTPDALAEAVHRAEAISWNSDAIRAHAQHFDTAVFQRTFTAFVDAAVAERDAQPAAE